MGIMPEQRDDMFLGDIFLYYRMYQKRQAKEWERARFLAWYSVLPYQKEGSKSTPFDVMKLDTDPTEEELKEWDEARRLEEIDEVKRIIQAHKDNGRQV